MAGPIIMALGPFAFESHGFGFTDRRRSTGTRWAEIPVAGGLNPSQWTGGDGQIESIRGVLFPHEFGGLASLNGITQAAIDGKILPWVSLAGEDDSDNAPANIFDMWIIEEVDEDHGFIDGYGRPMRDAYTINLKAYQGGRGVGFEPLSVLTFF